MSLPRFSQAPNSPLLPLRTLALLCLAMLLAAQMLPAGPPSGGVQSITDREITRRQRIVIDAESQLNEAILINSKGEHAQAAHQLATIYGMLPDAPAVTKLKVRVRAAYADAACAEAARLLGKAEYAKALALLDDVLDDDVDPKNPMALKLKRHAADPDRYPQALTPAHIANVDRVQELLVLAGSAVDLGDYNKAGRTYNEVLSKDPYNVAARRGLEKLEEHKSVYLDSARDQTRAKAFGEINKAWEDSVPLSNDLSAMFNSSAGGGKVTYGLREGLEKRLRTVIIPKAEFNGATLEEVIEYLRVSSRSNDPEGIGIGFVLNVEPEMRARAMTLSLVSVPVEEVLRYATEMTGTAYRVEENAVSIFSLSQKSAMMVQKTYRVPPDFIQKSEAAVSAAPDPFAVKPAAGGAASGIGNLQRMGAKEFLESRGVVFPDGGGASFSAATSTLTVRTTADAMNLVDTLVQSSTDNAPKQARITVRVVEVSQTNNSELGFDTLIGQFNLPGSDRVFGGGGTIGNQGDPAQFPSGSQGRTLSAGLRSSGALSGINSIDNQIATSRSNGDPPGLDGRSPTQFSLAGVFTDPQFQLAIRAIEQKKGSDTISIPSIITKSGQKATVRAGRQFPYPTEYDPPQIPQNVGGRQGGGGGGGGAGNSIIQFGLNGLLQYAATTQQSGGAPVVPATPTAFEVKELGMTLEVEPIISADGRTVEVSISPSLVEFDGFIDYGSDIKTSAPGYITSIFNAGVLTRTAPPTFTQPNNILQPVFHKSALGSPVVVNIYDGSTVTIGGLVTERTGDISDKVPVIGDIPLIGRFWQSKVRQTTKKAVYFFVTVDVLDPAGQKIHNDTVSAR